MSWICMHCDSNNDDSSVNCFVCGQPKSVRPTERPTVRPAERPTERPAERPTVRPAERPAERPTERPAERPTVRPAEPSHHETGSTPTVTPGHGADLKKTNRRNVILAILLLLLAILYIIKAAIE